MTANIMMAGGKLELIVAMMLGVRSVVVVVVGGHYGLTGCPMKTQKCLKNSGR